jgi:hypothetical protein
MSEENPRRRSSIAWTRTIRPGDPVDIEAEDAAYWLRFSPAERFLLTWELSQDLWKWVQNEESSEPGLSRSVARVHRS